VLSAIEVLGVMFNEENDHKPDLSKSCCVRNWDIGGKWGLLKEYYGTAFQASIDLL
jgi:hypothetical protein